MPRTKILKSPDDFEYKNLSSNINYECNIRGMSLDDILRAFGISKSCYYKKIKYAPETFTMKELARFSRRLNIPLVNLFAHRQEIEVKVDHVYKC